MTKQDLHLQEVKSEQDLMAFIRFLWETHTEEQLDKVLAAFEKVGKQMEVI